MKFSIVTVCYNAVDDIVDTFKSVYLQTYKNYEYIVIDGASTDGTLEVIKNTEKYFKAHGVSFKYISEKDNGIYDAMNKGIEMCEGEWVLFLNAGDYFASQNVLCEVFNEISNEYDGLYADTVIKNDNKYKYLEAKTLDYSVHMGACHQSIFVKNIILKKLHFDTNYKYCADHDLIIKMLKQGMKFKYIKMAISVFIIGGLTTSTGYYASRIENIYMMQKNGIIFDSEVKTRIRAIRREKNIYKIKSCIKRCIPIITYMRRGKVISSDFKEDTRYDYIYEMENIDGRKKD